MATKRASTEATAKPLGRAIGERLRVLREENGVRQEDVAAEARRFGLPWTRPTVAAIELGRRQLSIGELLVLPLILGRAQVWAYQYQPLREPDGSVGRVRVGHHPVSLPDLFPDDSRPVLVAGGTQVPGRVLCSLFAPRENRPGWPEAVQTPRAPVEDEAEEKAGSLPREWVIAQLESVKRHWATETPPRDWDDYEGRDQFWREVGLEAADDATRKAAAVLGVPSIAVALAARARWNGVWGLTSEREHRLAVLLHTLAFERDPPSVTTAEYQQWQLRDDPAAATSFGAALSRPFQRRLQALRGHLTRQLLAELAPVVRSLRKKAAKKRGR